MLKASNLAALEGVRHGFFSRRGGVSPDGEGDMNGLNCGFGSDDDPLNVQRNREIALERLGVAQGELVTAYQVHSAKVVQVVDAWPREDAPQVDGMASQNVGLVLGVLTADCAPVLFADASARVVAAAHAGWRGARGGVLEACVQEMVALGANPSNINAAIGPCIAQASYEVGPEFQQDFINEDVSNDAFFVTSKRAGHFMFDLTGYVEQCLMKMGLASIEGLGVDTCALPELFYSYRRCTLNGKKDYGRLLSAIALEE
jgi:polyphenol oxidase